jgi:hypothetical protein
VLDEFELTPAEITTLEQAARTIDECDRLDRAIRALPSLIAPGQMGQPRAHPLLSEARAHRLLLERLTTALALPDVDQEVGERGASKRARKAVQQRWRKTEHGSAQETAWRGRPG